MKNISFTRTNNHCLLFSNLLNSISPSFSKSLNNKNFFSHSHSTLIKNGLSSSSSLSNNSLAITWPDTSFTSKYNYIWLRDNCQCSQCVHPNSGQKLFSTANIPLDIKPLSINFMEDSVEVAWDKPLLLSLNTKGSQKSDSLFMSSIKSHKSIYSLNFLKAFSVVPSSSSLSIDSTTRLTNDITKINTSNPFLPRHNRFVNHILWDKSLFSEKITSIDYSNYMSSNKNLLKTLEHLWRYGLVFINNVPIALHQNEGEKQLAIENVVKRIGTIKNTFYGRTWDVVSLPGAKNIAYSNLELGLHMDLLYYESPPGIQLLHCLKNSAEGGSSIFSDSFKAIEVLKNKYPRDYQILVEVPITFQYVNDGHHMCFNRPLIVNDNYNNQTSHRIKDLSIIEDPDMKFEIRLNPGDLAMFMNRRVLHGRTSFDLRNGERHLKGSYIDLCEFKDKYRTLLSKYQDIKH
ncbi:12647_t:CDS:2 [Entrophospora sp. SA101]|nr:12647_t:CDS:2 [Entrophospora sp. SA101]